MFDMLDNMQRSNSNNDKTINTRLSEYFRSHVGSIRCSLQFGASPALHFDGFSMALLQPSMLAAYPWRFASLFGSWMPNITLGPSWVRQAVQHWHFISWQTFSLLYCIFLLAVLVIFLELRISLIEATWRLWQIFPAYIGSQAFLGLSWQTFPAHMALAQEAQTLPYSLLPSLRFGFRTPALLSLHLGHSRDRHTNPVGSVALPEHVSRRLD